MFSKRRQCSWLGFRLFCVLVLLLLVLLPFAGCFVCQRNFVRIICASPLCAFKVKHSFTDKQLNKSTLFLVGFFFFCSSRYRGKKSDWTILMVDIQFSLLFLSLLSSPFFVIAVSLSAIHFFSLSHYWIWGILSSARLLPPHTRSSESDSIEIRLAR